MKTSETFHRSDMFYLGAEQGANAAINACFGRPKILVPDFETPDEERDFWAGYGRGYASIDADI